jgi:hypothetical protein
MTELKRGRGRPKKESVNPYGQVKAVRAPNAKALTLTAMQEAFCDNVAKGMTNADAYRNSFNMKNKANEAVHKAANKLLQKQKIVDKIAELKKQYREPLLKKELWTREMSVKALIKAYNEGNAAAKVSAVKELNVMHGFNEPIKIQHTGSVDINLLSDEDLLKIINGR